MATVSNRIVYSRPGGVPVPPPQRLVLPRRPSGAALLAQQAHQPHPMIPQPAPVEPAASAATVPAEPKSAPFRILHVCLWKWNQPGFREPYSAERVNVAATMLRQNLRGVPHRIIVITDDRYGIEEELAEPKELWTDHDNIANASGHHLPSCYRRLKLFDPQTQEGLGIKKGDRVCSVDLDAVVTGQLANVVYRKERFVGWGVPGTYHPRVFNGSFWMFTAGDYQNIWSEFNPIESPRKALKSGFLGSDQGILSMHLARSGDAFGARWPDIASYPREIRRMRSLHPSTKIVFFHGGKKPWHPDVVRESPWITRFYKR